MCIGRRMIHWLYILTSNFSGSFHVVIFHLSVYHPFSTPTNENTISYDVMLFLFSPKRVFTCFCWTQPVVLGYSTNGGVNRVRSTYISFGTIIRSWVPTGPVTLLLREKGKICIVSDDKIVRDPPNETQFNSNWFVESKKWKVSFST